MDASGEIDVSKLTQKDREELQQFIVNETQKSKIQQCTSCEHGVGQTEK